MRNQPTSSKIRFLAVLSLMALPLIEPQPIQAQPASPSLTAFVDMQLTPETAIERLFTAPLQPDWFAESFLSQVPFEQIQAILTDIKTSLGPYQSIQSAENGYLLIFERGQAMAYINLDANGQIVGLLFQPRSNPIALEQVIQELQTFPGQVNLIVLEGDRELAALNSEQALAVGSTFKLAVLAALRQQIEAGDRAWSDVVELQPEWKSLPSGILQDWFDGALLTIQTLATLMISRSDNTATDALIHLVGRESIEALTQRNRPFLTTREAFVLKAAQNRELLEQYRAADTETRRQLLNTFAAYPLASATEFDADPVALDIEWFFTPRELCQLMAKVADLPLMSVNPGGGIINPRDWQRIAFKGGSEPGVLNLTTWLESPTGKTYCVSVTWNDQAPLAEQQLYSLYSGLVAGLKDE